MHQPDHQRTSKSILRSSNTQNLPGHLQGHRALPYTTKKSKLCVKGSDILREKLAFIWNQNASGPFQEMFLISTMHDIELQFQDTLNASRSRPVLRVGGRDVENERSAPAPRARTSQRDAGKHASLCEAMRSSRSVIYTPEALHFLEAPHIWLASNRTTFVSLDKE